MRYAETVSPKPRSSPAAPAYRWRNDCAARLSQDSTIRPRGCELEKFHWPPFRSIFDPIVAAPVALALVLAPHIALVRTPHPAIGVNRHVGSGRIKIVLARVPADISGA